MQGPTQRNKDDVCYRKDTMLHAGSARARRNARKTPIFYRGTQAEFQAIEALICQLGYRGRADCLADCVHLMALIAKGASDLGYADRLEAAQRGLEALSFLQGLAPIPDWCRLEAVPGFQPTPRLDKPTP
jgi:hypothetical protein